MEIISCEYSQPNSPQDWTRRREELWIIKSVQKIEILNWLPSCMVLEVQILMNWPKTLWACYTHIVLVVVQLAWRLVLKKVSFELNSISFSTAVSDLSSFGRKLIWLAKWSPNELKFLHKLKNSYIHISTKFHAYWTSSLGDMIFLSKEDRIWKLTTWELDCIETTRLS